MKKTYVWVCVADPKAQYVSEVHGPFTEHMMAEVNAELAKRPLQGFSENTAEVLCEIRLVAPEASFEEAFNDVIYMPGYLECAPVRPVKLRTLEKVLISR